MSFWDDQAEDPLTELIANPNTPVSDVLQEGTMLQELRTNNTDLIQYLSQERIITELCQWSMTLKDEKQDNYDKISRLATETLTCGINYAQELLKSQALEQFFRDFLNSTTEWDSSCAGHFQRIFVHLQKSSNGSFISRFPNIAEDLDKHLSILAVSEFIVQLVTEFNDSLPKQFVPILCEYISSTISQEGSTQKVDLFPAIYALRQIFNNGITIQSIQDSFTSENVIQHLAEAAKNAAHQEGSKLSSIELFRLLSRIRDLSPAAEELVSKHTAGIAKNNNEVTNALSSYETMNINVTSQQAATLLCNPVHWRLANNLLKQLSELPQDELVDIVVNQTQLYKTIITNCQNDALTPQQIDIIRLLSKAQYDTKDIPQEIVTKALLIGVRYGGEVPIGFQTEHKINGA